MRKPLVMSHRMLEQAARRFRYLGEPLRLRILKALSAGEMSAGELVTALAGNQPNVSRHLQLLYDGGLVARRKQGTSVFYTIADPVVFSLCDLVCRSLSANQRKEAAALQPSRRSLRHAR